MNRLILLSFSILAFFPIEAKHISLLDAQDIAQDFLKKEMKVPTRPFKTSDTSESNQNLYVFNAKDQQGFVIVSGDDRIVPILGYSDKGTFEEENAPDGALWLLNTYSEIIASLPENANDGLTYFKGAVPEMTGSAGPLLTTQWGQGSPYNNQCPEYNGKKCVTGCTATAIAQVINYNRNIDSFPSIPGYITSEPWNIVVEELPARNINWDNMDNEEIAYLMRYCGQAIRSYYSPYSTSGGFNLSAFVNYLGYSEDVCRISKEDYDELHWYEIIKAEIDNNRPVLYEGHTTSIGHCFVVDGYSDYLFHVNWGWEGSSDGYYAFISLGEGEYADYHITQNIVTYNNADPVEGGHLIDGVNYLLIKNEETGEFYAKVVPLKDGKYSGKVVIKSIVEENGREYPVTTLGKSCFKDCIDLTSVYIPKTITKLDFGSWDQFSGCPNLSILDFEDISTLITLELSHPFSNGTDLYSNGEKIVNLIIPEDISEIPHGTFEYCTSIETVYIPSSVKSIKYNAFANCPNLTKVEMANESVETIAFEVFSNNPNLREVILSSSLKKFGSLSFYQCGNICKIISPSKEPPTFEGSGNFTDEVIWECTLYVPDEAIEDYENSEIWEQFCEIIGLSEEKPCPIFDYTWVEGLQYEVDLANKSAKIVDSDTEFLSYKDITIPSTIKYDNINYDVIKIGNRAIKGNPNSISFEPGLKTLGYHALSDLYLQNVELILPNTLEKIYDYALYGLYTEILYLPISLKKIGSNQTLGREIISENPTPPEIKEDSFLFTFSSPTLYVPKGSKKKYQTHKIWSQFKDIRTIGLEEEIDPEYDINLTAELTGLTEIRKGMSISVEGTLRNLGTQKIDNIVLSYSFAGEESETEEIEYSVNLDYQDSYQFSLSIPIEGFTNPGEKQLLLFVKIKDIEDEDLSDNELSLPFTYFDKGYYRVSLLEEFASEESFSPKTIDSLYDYIEQTGWEDFIAVATIHLWDSLTITYDYLSLYWGSENATCASLNRTIYECENPCSPIDNYLVTKLKNAAGICNAVINVDLSIDADRVIVKSSIEKETDFDLTAGFDYFTVFLIEDSILSQNQYDYWTSSYVDYIHKNVVRHIFTNSWGDKVIWDGDVYARKYSVALDPEWNPENLHAVAFLHRHKDDDMSYQNVYTAGSTKLKQYGTLFNDDIYLESDPYQLGDANGDGEISITDAVVTIDYILSGGTTDIIFSTADVNGDNVITITDVVGIVDILLEAPQNTSKASAKDYSQPTIFLQSGNVNENSFGMSLCLNSNRIPISALQFDIMVSSGTELQDVRLSDNVTTGHLVKWSKIQDDQYRVIVFSLSNAVFNDQERSIVEFELSCGDTASGILVTNAYATSSNVVEYLLSPCSNTLPGTNSIVSIGYNNLYIYLEGRTLHIHAPKAMQVSLSRISGVANILNLQAGNNEYLLTQPGVYILGNHKVLVK